MRDRRSSLVAGRLLVAIAIGLACSVAAPLSCHAQTILPPRHSSVSGVDGTTVRDTIPPVISDSAKAAQLATLDSLFAKIDSVLARTRSWPADPIVMQSGAESNWRTRSYAGAIVFGLAANTVLHLDRDPCANGARICFRTAYHDSFLTRDKLDHFSASYFLTNSATEFGVPRAWAFGLTCGLAGPGFELTQGAVSWKDIAADCAGSATALGLRSLLTKMHDEGWFR